MLIINQWSINWQKKKKISKETETVKCHKSELYFLHEPDTYITCCARGKLNWITGACEMSEPHMKLNVWLPMT